MFYTKTIPNEYLLPYNEKRKQMAKQMVTSCFYIYNSLIYSKAHSLLVNHPRTLHFDQIVVLTSHNNGAFQQSRRNHTFET
jgi:hypothetical protein